MADPLATQQDYEAMWEVPPDLTNKLAWALAAASDYMNAEAGRVLVSQSYNEWYTGDGSAVLKLRQWPVTSVSSLTMGGTALTVMADGDVDTGQDVLIANGGKWLQARGFYFYSGASISVSYTAGYALGSVPPRLVSACVLIAKLLLMEREKIGTGGKTLGPEQVNLVVRKFSEYPMIEDALNSERGWL
jgi:hypothetical protein